MLVSARFHRLTLALVGLSIALNGALIAVLPLLYGAVREWRAWIRTPLDLPLGAFVLWSILAAAVARPSALPGFVVVVCGIYLAYQLPYRWFQADSSQVEVLGYWASLGLLVAVVLGILSYYYIPNPNLGSFRRFSLGQTLPGVYAYGLEVALLLSLAALPKHRTLVLVAFALGLFGLIGTASRWGLLGLSFGLFVWAAGMFKQSRRAVAAVCVTIVLAAAITLSLPLNRAIIEQYVAAAEGGNRWVQALRVGFGLRTGFSEHFSIWRGTIRLVQAHRWFGVGYGAFPAVYRQYFDPADVGILTLEAPVYLAPTHPHNDLLTVAAASGIPAALAYGAMLLVALARSLRKLSPMTAPAAAVLAASIVHGLFDAITTSFVSPFLAFWIVVSVAMQDYWPRRSPSVTE